MKRYLILLLMLSSCGTELIDVTEDGYSECRPSLAEVGAISPDDKTGLIEGDIIPMPSQKGVAIKNKLWADATIHYFFRDKAYDNGQVTMGFNEEERDLIRSYYAEFSMLTGITFIEHENAEELRKVSNNGIEIVPSIGNASYLGMIGGIQDLKYGYSLKKEVVFHEIMHALGVCHEFTRHDRDKYIIIRFDNILERYWKQFDIREDSFDCGKFDIESVMMYPQFHLSIDKGIPTISLVGGGKYEMSTELSQGDIKTIKALYSLDK